MRAEVAYSYIRDLLERITGQRPTPDPDGDLPVQLGGARFYVRIVGNHDAWVQVFSIALADITATPELLARLNDINSQIRFARRLLRQFPRKSRQGVGEVIVHSVSERERFGSVTYIEAVRFPRRAGCPCPQVDGAPIVGDLGGPGVVVDEFDALDLQPIQLPAENRWVSTVDAEKSTVGENQRVLLP